MWNKKYLNADHLAGFDKYKYTCVDTSWFSKFVMHPFWNWIVKFVPPYVAPNLITFAGFMLTVFNYLLIGYYDYYFHVANGTEDYVIPRWVFILAGINVFVAYTLDGIDGKQARKTGTSTPLGELFDHGLDSYSSIFIMIYLFSLFGTNDLPAVRMHFITYCVYLNFYLTHFEKYNTNVLFLPYAYDYVMWSCSFTLLIAGIFGPKLFVTPIFGITPTVYVELIMYISGLLTSHPVIAWNIYKSYRDKTGKMRPMIELFRPLYPVFGLFAVSTLWLVFSPNKIMDVDPRMFIMVTGTIFSNISCRLIVAQMSDTRTDGWNSQLWIYLLTVLICIFPFPLFGFPQMTLVVEKYILYILVGILSIQHFHYGYSVVNEMCQHFGIKCFTIKPKQSARNGEAMQFVRDKV
ncbi:ethanolaminephosphotransferase 1 isoform X2 [Chironomus tepperi]|uniref:ethanolaminephosphotransferase 1 isoform X2 n=1 Tax=Chironomus tepperi TaxID=113505 RepID=UPI00391FAB1A